MRTQNAQDTSIPLGEIGVARASIECYGDRRGGRPLEAPEHERHLVLDPGAAVVLVVDLQAVQLLPSQKIRQLVW